MPNRKSCIISAKGRDVEQFLRFLAILVTYQDPLYSICRSPQTMFDLFRRRDKAVRILLGVILGLVALSMLLYLVPGAGMTGNTGNDNVIAEIGQDTVTTND